MSAQVRQSPGVLAVAVERLVVDLRSARVLDGIDLELRAGEICAIVGPNGAGKSTLLRAVAGLVPLASGSVRLAGIDPASLDRRARSRLVAYVPQQIVSPPGYSTEDVVAMGRAPHQGRWMRASATDAEAVRRALEASDLVALAGRPVASLSGGEQQRVAVARVLAQSAPVLLLDEAAAHLDLRHTAATLALVRADVNARGAACLAVMHDLNAAAAFADRVLVLEGGRVAADVGPDDLDPALLERVFGVALEVGTRESGLGRWILPRIPRSRPERPGDL